VAEARKLAGLEVERLGEGAVQVDVQWKVKYGRGPFRTRYTVQGDGSVLVEAEFEARREMARMGMMVEIPGRLNRMTWFGRGPQETMWDRNSGAPVGLYSDDVENLIHDYVRPQENGNRSDVRWARLTEEAGNGLEVRADGEDLLNVTARPYTQEDLARATHIHELPRRDTVTLCIDYQQRGVGGDVPANSVPHDEYRLWEDRSYRYSFWLRPYRVGDGTKASGDRSVAEKVSEVPPSEITLEPEVNEPRAKVRRAALVAGLCLGLAAAGALLWWHKRR
jgi:beta-galactosidase